MPGDKEPMMRSEDNILPKLANYLILLTVYNRMFHSDEMPQQNTQSNLLLLSYLGQLDRNIYDNFSENMSKAYRQIGKINDEQGYDKLSRNMGTLTHGAQDIYKSLRTSHRSLDIFSSYGATKLNQLVGSEIASTAHDVGDEKEYGQNHVQQKQSLDLNGHQSSVTLKA